MHKAVDIIETWTFKTEHAPAYFDTWQSVTNFYASATYPQAGRIHH